MAKIFDSVLNLGIMIEKNYKLFSLNLDNNTKEKKIISMPRTERVCRCVEIVANNRRRYLLYDILMCVFFVIETRVHD